MEVVKFIKDYWAILCFLASAIVGLVVFILTMIEAIKCSLRNDILTIYNDCKEKKEITSFELEAILHSAKVYFKLRGNSFVKQIVEIVKTFKLTD